MSSTLLLMRHGKAKNRGEEVDDFTRELTEAGKRSLKAMLPGQLAFAGSLEGPIEVWSSPATRAMQTAELLVDALKGCGVKVTGDIREVNALWEQDADVLTDMVSESKAATVIVVGHEPMVSELTESLVGARIPFATGGIAAMEIPLESAPEGVPGAANETENRLLWFSQGPVSQRWRTLVRMEHILEDGSETIGKRLDAFFEDPDDVETMHKFRVSIRTLRSLLAFVKPWQDEKQNAAMQADLKEVVGATSRLRELDVLAEQSRDAEATSDALVEFCEAEAAAERERVMKVLAGKDVRKRLERTAKEARSIRWKRAFRDKGLASTEVRERFDRMADKLQLSLEQLDLADVEPTHDVRKSAKRVRYAAEQFKDIVGEDAIDVAKGMTAHQDNLGAVCDARVNIDMVNDFLKRPDLPEQVAWDLTLLRAKNEMFLYTTLREGGRGASPRS